jgi:hypothetical protein
MSTLSDTLYSNESCTAITIANLGSPENFDKFMSLVEEYNLNETTLMMKATELRTTTDDAKFNYKTCLHDELLFQHFVKSSPHFIKSQWYMQDYATTRLLGLETNITELL